MAPVLRQMPVDGKGKVALAMAVPIGANYNRSVAEWRCVAHTAPFVLFVPFVVKKYS